MVISIFQICNLFETTSSSEWLLYISEWNREGLQLSNVRVTTKVAVTALLSNMPSLQEKGTALMHNLATKEVKSAVCITYTLVCSTISSALSLVAHETVLLLQIKHMK